VSTSNSFPEDVIAAAKQIKLLALDVDGVLTDGYIYVDSNGNELKKFYAHDGYGIVSIREKFGIETVVISGRSSKALLHRLEELNISRFWIGQTDKLSAINLILQEGIKPHQILFVGDDIPDLNVIESVGLFVAVRNAHKMLKNKAHYITQNFGGQGAVREVCDLIEYSNERAKND
jgi:3-deoxy-D-manno-octulosonate 8-phosphate phosphatase (KDO 8-P phosphatase)